MKPGICLTIRKYSSKNRGYARKDKKKGLIRLGKFAITSSNELVSRFNIPEDWFGLLVLYS